LKGIGGPAGFAIDDNAVYFAVRGASLSGQTVDDALLRIPKGGAVGAALTTGLQNPTSVAVYGPDAYFLEQLDTPDTKRGLRSIPKAGGSVTPLASAPAVELFDVFVDSSGAYVTTFTGKLSPNVGTLLRVALDGSSTSELATTPAGHYRHVRTSATAIYWTIDWTADRPPADGASVRKLCK